MKRWLSILAGLVLACPGLAAAACDLVVTGMEFGDYWPTDARHRDSTGEIRVSCQGEPGQMLYRIRLSSGNSGSFAARAMSGGGTLNYNLFRDPARSRVWGDGSSGTEVVVGWLVNPRGDGPVSRRHLVYGRLFAGQGVIPGAYVDLIQVTVEACNTRQECQTLQAPLAIR